MESAVALSHVSNTPKLSPAPLNRLRRQISSPTPVNHIRWQISSRTPVNHIRWQISSPAHVNHIAARAFGSEGGSGDDIRWMRKHPEEDLTEKHERLEKASGVYMWITMRAPLLPPCLPRLCYGDSATKWKNLRIVVLNMIPVAFLIIFLRWFTRYLLK